MAKKITRHSEIPTSKRPVSQAASIKKQPRYGPVVREEFPSWHFSCLDWEGPFGWETIRRDEMRDLIGILKSFECNTWREILAQGGGKKRHHFMAMKDICPDAQKRLAEIRQDDIDDQLFSFRIAAKKRLWGIVDRHLFKILWWDPDHRVYPMNITDN